MKRAIPIEPTPMKYPFEASYEEILADPDRYVTAVFSSLVSEFLILPKGAGFVEYAQFEAGYEALKKVTAGFSKLPRAEILKLVAATPICLIVIRSILGFSPPEWAYVASQRKGIAVNQSFAMLLYERFLGRPFAGHRDSVSELVGDNLESAVEDVLSKAGISYRKTKRAERIPGFDQSPDFIVPDEFNAQVVLEAKLTEDDGTARDKVTRIQHLGELSLAGAPPGQQKFQVIACIAGRGFGVRREDMRKMLLATRGKVFTLKDLGRLVECTRLAEFRTR